MLDHFSPLQTPKLTPARIVTLASVVLLGLVSYLWSQERAQKFPRLAIGNYRGVINSISPDGASIPLYVELKNEKSIRFFPVYKMLQPREIETVSRSNTLDPTESLLPISFSDGDVQWKFIGNASGDKFEGTVYDLNTGKSGSWSIQKIAPNTNSSSSQALQTKALVWLSLKQQSDVLAEENKTLLQQIDSRKNEGKKLTAYIADSKQLKESADRKYRDENDALVKINQINKKELFEIEKLRKQVDLAQKLSSMGKLVLLSRESLAKERIWFTSTLKIDETESDSLVDLDQYERARKVIELQQEIKREKDALAALSNSGGVHDAE